MALFREFRIKDAVEGAVEVRLELAGALRSYGPRFSATVGALVLAILLAWATLGVHAYSSADLLWDAFSGERELSWVLLLVLAGDAVVMLLMAALAGTVLVFLHQIRRFLALLGARYGTLAGDEEERPRRPSKRSKDVDEDASAAARDPVSALLGLAREAEGEVPEVDRLVRYVTALTFLLVGLMALEISIALAGYAPLPDGWVLVVSGLQGLALVLLVASVLLLFEGQRFLRYFLARVRALEAFESQPPVSVPEGPGVVQRFTTCLLASGKAVAGPVKADRLMGASGNEHAFDLVLGGVGERVLVRVFDHVPGLNEVRSLRKAAEDVAKREGGLPTRVVALVGQELDDLDVEDSVYEYLMGNPIVDEREDRERSVQIVAEVGGHYAVLPYTHL